MSEHPFLADDFHIRWSTLKAEHIEADIEEGLRLAEERLEAIRNLSADEVTYENTFGALENAGEELERGWGRLSHLDSVNDHDEQRAGMNLMLPKLSAYSSSIPLDAKIWASLKAFSEGDGMKGLNDVQTRLVEETCFDFVSSGANLGDADKKRVAEIAAELSKATKKFSENVLDSTNAWELIISDESRLAGRKFGKLAVLWVMVVSMIILS